MNKLCTRVYFSLKKNRVTKDGKSPIQVSISCNAERIYFFTGKTALLSEWNNLKQCVKGKSDEANQTNNYLIQLRKKIFDKEVELMERGFLITPQLLKDAIFNKVELLKERSLLEVLNEHNIEQKELVGKTVAPATYYCFEHTGRLLSDFVKTTFHRNDLCLRELNVGFIEKFHHHLLKTMSQNTCTKHLKFLKKLLNQAVSRGYILYNPFNAYRVEREPVTIDFLTESELRKIINFDTPLQRLEYARDCFLFGCFTGLSYIDIKTLTTDHFEKDTEGRIWIKKQRVKTGIIARIPLLPMAKLILEKYKGNCGQKLLPLQDPKDINIYIKDIATLCGINKNITFHTSRHTFASTVTLANNVSIEVVSKMLGHTNIRMTTHYAKLVDRCIAEQMDKITDIFTFEEE